MPEPAGQSRELRRLTALVAEIRAELTVTQAALAAAMAEIARRGPEPRAELADAVSRLIGFAEAAAAGLRTQPEARAQAPTDAALRMADWAEGVLGTSPQ